MIKLVVSDMDGTLLDDHSQISEQNVKAIKSLQEKGIGFAIASGRDYEGVYSILKQYGIHCEAILGNGAQYVDDDGLILLECYMDKSVVKKVVSLFEEHYPYMIFTTKGFYTTQSPEYVRDAFIQRNLRLFDVDIHEYGQGGNYENTPVNHLQKINDMNQFLKEDLQIIKIESFSLSLEEGTKVREQLRHIEGIAYLSSFFDNIEVTHQQAQKGYILEKVMEMKGLSHDQIAVIGNGMNDITMFEKFSYSFVPENGEQCLKDMAYRTVKSCDNDGVSDAIDIILRDLL